MPNVWLNLAEHDALTREAARLYPDETGGLLLGYRGEDEWIVITRIIGPGPDAVHGRYFFIPDHNYHEREVAKTYNDSGRRWTYLGDWHSHPGGSTRLSITDRRTLRRISCAPEARAPQPLMMVVAGLPSAWHIAVHRLLRSHWRSQTQELTLFSFR